MDIFEWTIPGGPGNPFGSTTLVVLDCLRIFIVFCGTLTVLLSIPAALMTWNITQKYRILCISLFSVYVSLTEIQRIGDFANWRLLLGAVCAIWAATSLLAFIQFEGNREHAARWVKWMLRPRKDRDA